MLSPSFLASLLNKIIADCFEKKLSEQYDGNDFFLPPELHGFFECAEREREKGGEDMRSQYVSCSQGSLHLYRTEINHLLPCFVHLFSRRLVQFAF